MLARRSQPAITIRSQRAVDRLRILTRDGRSQAEVIEEALDRVPEPPVDDDENSFFRKIDEIQARIALKPQRFKNMAEFDAHEYDERGNLR